MFENFLLGLRAGTEDRAARQRQNALMQIGRQAQANNWTGAASTAFGAGLPELGAQFRGYGQEAERRQRNQQIGGLVAQNDLSGAARMAAKAGDLPLFEGLTAFYNQADERTRQQMRENTQFFGTLAGLPRIRQAAPNERGALLRQFITGSTHDSPQIQEIITRLEADGVTDDELDFYETQFLTASERFERQERERAQAIDQAFGQAVAAGQTGETLERSIAGLQGGGAIAFQLQQQRLANEQQAQLLRSRAASGGGYGGGARFAILSPEQMQEQFNVAVTQPVQVDTITGQVRSLPGAVGADASSATRFALNTTNLLRAEETLAAVMGEDAERNPLTREWGATAAEMIPFDQGAVARMIGSEEYNLVRQASNTFETAILPILSGAAVTESEAQRFVQSALPALGDSPRVLLEKQRMRRQMINGVYRLQNLEPPYPGEGELLPPGARPLTSPAPSAESDEQVFEYDIERGELR